MRSMIRRAESSFVSHFMTPWATPVDQAGYEQVVDSGIFGAMKGKPGVSVDSGWSASHAQKVETPT
jgi:hypothetical protein